MAQAADDKETEKDPVEALKDALGETREKLEDVMNEEDQQEKSLDDEVGGQTSGGGQPTDSVQGSSTAVKPASGGQTQTSNQSQPTQPDGQIQSGTSVGQQQSQGQNQNTNQASTNNPQVNDRQKN